MVIIHCVRIGLKQNGRKCVHEILILEVIFEVIFVTLTENSSAVTNDTQGPQKYAHHQK